MHTNTQSRIQKVAIIHGYRGSSATHWQSWLARKCKAAGLETIYPKLPDRFDKPELAAWLEALNRTLPIIDKTTALVGHSLGCATILQQLRARNDAAPGLVILVAPSSPSRISTHIADQDVSAALLGFYEGLDRTTVAAVGSRITTKHIVHSLDDKWVNPQETLHNVALPLLGLWTVIPYGGHLNVDTDYHTYPPIFEAIVNYPKIVHLGYEPQSTARRLIEIIPPGF